MICTPEDLRNFRDVSENISPAFKIEPILRQVELVKIIDKLSARLYKQFDEFEPGADYYNFTNLNGDIVTLSEDQIRTALDGGYYSATKECSCVGDGYTNGLKMVIAYYFYEAYVLSGQINLTAFGVVTKRTEYSQPADATLSNIESVRNRKLAEACMGTVLDYLRAINLIPCSCKKHRSGNWFRTVDKGNLL